MGISSRESDAASERIRCGAPSARCWGWTTTVRPCGARLTGSDRTCHSRRLNGGSRMTKRLLDTTARELAGYGREEVLASIRASEGRVLAAEVIAPAMAAVHDVSNPEVAAAMGADLVVLNLLDVRRPAVHAIEVADAADVVREVKRLTGRLVAVNLEPVDPHADRVTDDHFGPGGTSGRLATQENIAAAVRLGIDAVVLTGNPGMGVTNDLTRPRRRRHARGRRA